MEFYKRRNLSLSARYLIVVELFVFVELIKILNYCVLLCICDAGWNRQVSKSASMMITVLEAVVETRIAVRNILISDYFDEIIDLAYTESRSSSASSASAATSDRKGGSSDEDVIRPRYVLSYISNCLRPPHM